MENQDHNLTETSDSRTPDCALERREKNSAQRLYCPPQVSLVGKAQRLMAGGSMGIAPDEPNDGGWHNLPRH
ncbi:MAG: hypothetical protein E6J34_16740 [Chloroflexi bacterium]|nr:MAG: hypothetical protein E6J34_16740 [Chloroflexota bacterium]